MQHPDPHEQIVINHPPAFNFLFPLQKVTVFQYQYLRFNYPVDATYLRHDTSGTLTLRLGAMCLSIACWKLASLTEYSLALQSRSRNKLFSPQNDEKEEIGNPSIYYLTSINDSLLQVLWGKLAREILSKDWEAAFPSLWMPSSLEWSPWCLPTRCLLSKGPFATNLYY
jgi:hypothetical protein